LILSLKEHLSIPDTATVDTDLINQARIEITGGNYKNVYNLIKKL
jgi:hypothetical protein